MSADFNFAVASWFLRNVHVKPISTQKPSPRIFRPSYGPGVCLPLCPTSAAAALCNFVCKSNLIYAREALCKKSPAFLSERTI